MFNWDYVGWEDFFNAAENRRVVIWGGGNRCKELLPYFARRFKEILIVDRKKFGQEINGIRILEPEVLASMNDVVVLIVGQFPYSIRLELEAINPIIPFFSEWWIEHGEYIVKHTRFQPKLDIDRARNVCEFLSDEESKRVYNEIIKKRYRGIADYSDIRSKEGYFPRDIFELSDREIYVDCGAFNGDTIKEFIDVVDGNFRHIVAYEADPYNYKKIQESLIYFLNKEKVSLFNLAVSSSEKEIQLCAGIDASSYCKELDDDSFAPRNIEYQTINIGSVCLDKHIGDNTERYPTIIKMDIEGCEVDAIKGAQKLIKEHKPKLAICIYHKEMDFVDIPELIHELVPEYRLFIRHQSMLYFDTILYATL